MGACVSGGLRAFQGSGPIALSETRAVVSGPGALQGKVCSVAKTGFLTLWTPTSFPSQNTPSGTVSSVLCETTTQPPEAVSHLPHSIPTGIPFECADSKVTSGPSGWRKWSPGFGEKLWTCRHMLSTWNSWNSNPHSTGLARSSQSHRPLPERQGTLLTGGTYCCSSSNWFLFGRIRADPRVINAQ